jgi:hypothetical protein
MTDHHFDVVMVWDKLGSAVRVRPGATASVLDPVTGAALTVTQNGVPTTVVTADANGRVSFIAQTGYLKLSSGGLVQLLTSAEGNGGSGGGTAGSSIGVDPDGVPYYS